MKTPEHYDGCPYCRFGLPPKVRELYARLAFDPDEHAYGVGHVVFDDENYDTASIEWCQANCGRDDEEVRRVLTALLQIPEQERTWDDPNYVYHPPKLHPPRRESIERLDALLRRAEELPWHFWCKFMVHVMVDNQPRERQGFMITVWENKLEQVFDAYAEFLKIPNLNEKDLPPKG